MSEEPMDAGSVWTPNFRKVGPDFMPPADRCCANVADGGRSVTFHQCNRKPKVHRTVTWHRRIVTLGYCGIHDPVAVKAKQEARNAKWRAEWDERTRKQEEAKRLRALRDDALDALKRIARGDNDPRRLAIETLERHGEDWA